MFSSQIPMTCLHFRNEKPLSSVKLHSTVGKRTGEVPASIPPPKPRLAMAGVPNSEGSRVVLRAELMPKHVALIMDGNGRWARSRGMPVQEGHKAGSVNLKRIVSKCCELGIRVFTVFVFSTENWKRSKPEVDVLMNCIEDFIKVDVKELRERDDMRFLSIGNRWMLPESLQTTICAAEEWSKGNKGMQLVSALSYSGKSDMIEATKRVASKVKDGDLQEVDELGVLEQHLMTNVLDFPNPDLLIRTSGELRLSNFLLWQLAYTELYFSDKLFPDFGEEDLIHAFTSFQRRHRRFGDRHSG